MSGLYPAIEASSEVTTVPGTAQEVKTAQPSKQPAYAGEPGPQEKRECKDVFFIILFGLFWIGMAVIAGLAIKQGNLDRLRYGNDTEGNLCGVNNIDGRNLVSKPYQYVFDPTSLNSYRICVSSCPNATFQPICPYDVSVPSFNSSATYATLAQQYFNGTFGNCTLTYKSKMILNRCLPDLLQLSSLLNVTNANGTGSVLSETQSIGAEIFSDVYNSWSIILICSFIALGLSFIWLFFIQFFASFMVWLTIVFVNMASIAFTTLIWSYYRNVNVQNDGASGFAPTDSQSANSKLLLAISIVFSVLTALLIIMTISLRSRINLAVAIIKETSKAIRKMPMVIFFPIFKYVLLLALVAWTIYIWANLVTAGSKVTESIQNQVANATSYNVVRFSENRAFQYLTIYYALGFYWTFNLIIAMTQTTVAGAVASWYWARDKTAIPSNAVSRSFGRVLRYHMGSLAFGSLIIAIVETIRSIVFYIQQQMKKQQASKAIQCCLSCVQCCLGCIESLIKFINKNAYIEIAVYGYSFCEAARTAFGLLLRNAIRVVVVDKVADFLFFLGKIMITLNVAIIGSSWLQQPQSLADGETLNIGRFWGVSLLLIILSSYTIASCFMAVYDMAISTIFLCFCEDSERNDGSAAKPYYMEDTLRKFVEGKKADVKV